MGEALALGFKIYHAGKALKKNPLCVEKVNPP
jgi:hypothetical protein